MQYNKPETLCDKLMLIYDKVEDYTPIEDKEILIMYIGEIMEYLMEG